MKASADRGSFGLFETRPMLECEQIFQALVSLVKDGKIFPVEHTTVIDQSYQPVSLDEARLKAELKRSMKPYNVDPDSFYWFLATEEGKKDDLSYRRSLRDNPSLGG